MAEHPHCYINNCNRPADGTIHHPWMLKPEPICTRCALHFEGVKPKPFAPKDG